MFEEGGEGLRYMEISVLGVVLKSQYNIALLLYIYKVPIFFKFNLL